MDRYQGRVWYERAIYYQQIGDKENAREAYKLAQDYDPHIPPLPKNKDQSIWRKLEIASLVAAIFCLLFVIFLLWQQPDLLTRGGFPSRIAKLRGEPASEPEVVPVSYAATQRTADPKKDFPAPDFVTFKQDGSFHLLRNALYYYLEDHIKFPSQLNQLVEKKYLTRLPAEPVSGSNLVYNDFTDTGGWLYTPPGVIAPHRRSEQIEVALGANRGNVPHQPFRPVRLQVNRTKAKIMLMQGNQPIKSWPVSVGVTNTPTPAGTFRVIKKNLLANSDGSNTYGSRWLQIGEHYPYGDAPPVQPDQLAGKGIGIHGTNEPTTIGTPNTQGCIRMRNEDVEELYDLIPNGIDITIE